MKWIVMVGVVCFGVVTAWGGVRFEALKPSGVQGKQAGSMGTVGSSSKHLGSAATPEAAQEGKDFSGSVILENRGFKGVGNKFLFRWIKPGTFLMGSTSGTDPDRSKNEDQHQVQLRGFWILDHELTQGEYEKVMRSNPAYNRGASQPVECVPLYRALEFCKTLTDMDREKRVISPTQEYRLPTEAEWEYAARAGTTGSRYTVDGKNVVESLDLIAWYYGNSGGHPHVVMEKAPNAWLLWDMLGNVWELCSERTGSGYMLRGGSFYEGNYAARSAARISSDPGPRDSTVGFRPVLSSVR